MSAVFQVTGYLNLASTRSLPLFKETLKRILHPWFQVTRGMSIASVIITSNTHRCSLLAVVLGSILAFELRNDDVGTSTIWDVDSGAHGNKLDKNQVLGKPPTTAEGNSAPPSRSPRRGFCCKSHRVSKWISLTKFPSSTHIQLVRIEFQESAVQMVRTKRSKGSITEVVMQTTSHVT